MLNRSLATQLLLCFVVFGIWSLYFGSRCWFRRHAASSRDRSSLFYGLLSAYAVGHILFVGYAWINRAAFPLNLETMELLKLQHVKRLLTGLPIYVEPSAEFIPLVYNPLYYYLVLPFTWVWGVNLLALRIASIVGATGAYLVVFLAVRQVVRRSRPLPTQNAGPANGWWLEQANWWGLMAVGLMAAAFRVMDTYLDNAAADSWMLFTILLGCYLIGRNRTYALNFLGLLCLIAAFWLKQYGAIFTIGAVVYLTWRDGLRRAWPYWLSATLFGPVLYFLVPPQWFGAEFHYYTWAIPRQWTQIGFQSTFLRVVKFIVKHYGWLAFTGGLLWVWLLWRNRRGMSIWLFMFPFALLSGPYVALDPGNNNNVFIPLGTWLIIVGVLSIHYWAKRFSVTARWGAPLFLFGASFALLSYNPTTILVSPDTTEAYADLVATVDALDGVVYAPGVGQLQDRELFYPTAHWVTLIDLIRKPGVDLCRQPLTRDLLAPVLNPAGPAYILLEHPLEEDAMLAFLADRYELKADFGNRYIALRDSPKLLEMGWPTYLYGYVSGQNTATWVEGALQGCG